MPVFDYFVHSLAKECAREQEAAIAQGRATHCARHCQSWARTAIGLYRESYDIRGVSDTGNAGEPQRSGTLLKLFEIEPQLVNWTDLEKPFDCHTAPEVERLCAHARKQDPRTNFLRNHEALLDLMAVLDACDCQPLLLHLLVVKNEAKFSQALQSHCGSMCDRIKTSFHAVLFGLDTNGHHLSQAVSQFLSKPFLNFAIGRVELMEPRGVTQVGRIQPSGDGSCCVNTPNRWLAHLVNMDGHWQLEMLWVPDDADSRDGTLLVFNERISEASTQRHHTVQRQAESLNVRITDTVSYNFTGHFSDEAYTSSGWKCLALYRQFLHNSEALWKEYRSSRLEQDRSVMLHSLLDKNGERRALRGNIGPLMLFRHVVAKLCVQLKCSRVDQTAPNSAFDRRDVAQGRQPSSDSPCGEQSAQTTASQDPPWTRPPSSSPLASDFLSPMLAGNEVSRRAGRACPIPTSSSTFGHQPRDMQSVAIPGQGSSSLEIPQASTSMPSSFGKGSNAMDPEPGRNGRSRMHEKREDHSARQAAARHDAALSDARDLGVSGTKQPNEGLTQLRAEPEDGIRDSTGRMVRALMEHIEAA